MLYVPKLEPENPLPDEAGRVVDSVRTFCSNTVILPAIFISFLFPGGKFE